MTHKKYVDDAINGVRGELEVLKSTPPFKGAELEAVRRASGLIMSGSTAINASESTSDAVDITRPHPCYPGAFDF